MDKSDQAHGPKLLCVLRRAPKACISSVSSVSQYLSVSHICIFVIIIPHAYAPKRQKRPNTWPKASMCVQTGPKGLSSHLISSVSLYLEGRVLSNDFKNNHYTHIHILLNHILNHTTFKSTFLIFKILSCFIQSRYAKSLTKHFNKIPMRG